MNDVTVLAASADTRRGLTIGLFLLFILITLYITWWASRQNKTAADFYAAGRSFSSFQNGMAISGVETGYSDLDEITAGRVLCHTWATSHLGSISSEL
jgi:hypothetical protein